MNEFVPSDVLSMWAAGIGFGGASVTGWRIVGPGFARLVGGVAVALAATALLVEFRPAVVVGVVAGSVAVFGARRVELATIGLAGSAGVLIGFASGRIVPAITGALLLGGVSVVMLLGHWFLVDPRVPRWALHRLDLIAGAGLVLELGQLSVRGVFGWSPADLVLGWAFIGAAVFTAILMVAVWFSLKEPTYSGVMAATGLSYLAVMTAAATVIIGRILLEGAA